MGFTTNVNYSVATAGSVAARASPVSISYQEFFQMVSMLTQYLNQLNMA